MLSVYYLKKYLWLLPLTATAQLTPNQKSYLLYKPEIEYDVMEEMYAVLRMRMFTENTTFPGKDDLTSKFEWRGWEGNEYGIYILVFVLTVPGLLGPCRFWFGALAFCKMEINNFIRRNLKGR